MIVSDGRYWVSRCCKCDVVKRPDGWYPLDIVEPDIEAEAKAHNAAITYTHTFCPECAAVENSKVDSTPFIDGMAEEISRINLRKKVKGNTQLELIV
jgi:hypothetical protein